MKKLSYTVCMVAMIAICNNSSAQLLDKIKNKTKARADQKVDQTIDKGLDKAEGSTKTKTKTEDGEVKEKTENGETKVKTEATNTESLKAYSKYDFVQGEKVIALEDFSRTDVGDFPTNWNTNATAEVVTLNSKDGKWLKISKEGVWMPEFITNLPDNFTFEFDLGVTNDFDGSAFVLNIANLKNKDKDYTDFYHYVNWRHGHALHLEIRPSNGRVSAWGKILTATDGNYLINNTVEFKDWDNSKNNFAHVSLWRQNQRLRMYVNGQKVFDIPKAFEAEGKYNSITFAMQGSYKPEEYQYFLGNTRLAVGAPDTRNKLITDGKFVTTGITFDVNSDKLKPTSYGVLKEIAAALKENPDVRVKVIGHTDSDGDDAKNLDLSKRRAASVRIALTTEFGIDGSRFETDGMGETNPVGDNKTMEGKAQNRRVEFVKL